MSRQSARVDRLTQMTRQEELIAKKRQEILNKQRTAQLAKAVAAAQSHAAELKAKEEGDEQINGAEVEERTSDSAMEEVKFEEVGADITSKKNQLSSKTGKVMFCAKRAHTQPAVIEEPPSKAVNTFCNDGSFLENFKKILENSEQPKPLLVPETFAKLTGQVVEEPPAVVEQPEQNEDEVYKLHATLFNQQLQAQKIVTSHEQILIPHLSMTLTQPPPPPPPATSMEGAVHASFFTTTAGGVVPVPPPPPPPQIPLTLTQFLPPPSLFMIPPPEAMQLNALHANKEFNLNAIPQQKLNMDIMQTPEQQQQQQQQQNVIEEKQQQDTQGVLIY